MENVREKPIRNGVARSPVDMPRHSAFVRITHWLIVLSVFGLLASGFGILISHPRLYWGETGGIGMPSLIDLPLPRILGPSVWNRPYHFLFAWLFVFVWLIYAVGALTEKERRARLIPSRKELRFGHLIEIASAHMRGQRVAEDDTGSYNAVQKLTYLAVIFFLVPAVILSGLGMSFGVTSVFPFLATTFGGHQSVRTLHFIFASLLTLFGVVHVLMLFVAGVAPRLRAMTIGVPEGAAK